MDTDGYEWIDDMEVNKTIGIPYIGGLLIESISNNNLKLDESTSNESPKMDLFGGIVLTTDSGMKMNILGGGNGMGSRLIPPKEMDTFNLTGRDMITEDINNNKTADELENYNYIKPSHYINENKKFTRNDGKLEVFDIIDYYDLDFYSGNILKYIVRCGKKPNESMLKDLKKALAYLERKIKNENKQI